MTEITHRFVETNGINMHIAEAGEGPLVVLCHHGQRSGHVTAWLRRLGYDNAVNLEGGIDAWARVIDPAMPTY